MPMKFSESTLFCFSLLSDATHINESSLGSLTMFKNNKSLGIKKNLRIITLVSTLQGQLLTYRSEVRNLNY